MMGPSPVNNWTEKNKGDSVPQTALQEYVKKILTWLLLKYQFIFLDLQL